MPDFRKWIIALALLALFTGLASAQGGGVGGGSNGGTPFSCTVTNGAVTPTLRAEGYTELTGDILLVCSGGSQTALGAVVPTATVTVFLNTAVTSRLLGTNSVTGASEALMIIDEPGSGEPGYGPALAQNVCGSPSSGAQNPPPPGVTGVCPQWVGQTSITGSTVTNVPVASNPNTGTGGTYVAQNLSPGANVFQGVVSGSQVTFFGIPVLPPVSTGLERVFRITNIRANAAGITAGGPTPGSVTASISISSSSSIPITNSTITVGFVQQGLTAAFRNTSQSGSSGGAALAQCTSLSTGSGVGILQYNENFATAFKNQYGTPGTVSGYPVSAQRPTTQNVPGQVFNSESGFVLNSQLGTSTSTGSQYFPGQADYGTRLKAMFTNIPSGVSIFVSTRDIINTFGVGSAGFFPVGIVSGGTAPQNANAVLVVNENSPSNGAVPIVTQCGTTGPSSSFQAPIAPVTISGGTGTAVWEVVQQNPSALDSFNFGVYVSYTAAAATNSPTPGNMTVTMSFAPTPTGLQFTAATGSAASSTLTIPRFSDALDQTKTIASVTLCSTALLFPYVTNINGFDTGMVLANTTTDVFGTAAQQGTCTINFYSAPTATATFTTPNIVSGSVYANLASQMDAGFNGYAIAVCNFQYAHGFAFISDVGARNLAMGYLALIFTSSTSINRGGTAENLNN